MMRYYPKNLYAVPQYIAGLTFYPMGLFFGYYLNLFYLNQGTQELLSKVSVWPIFAGVLAAGITAFIQIAIKIIRKKYSYEHFYLLMVGLFCIFVGGIIISNNETDVGSSLFACFVGHGISYVSTLSYINIRTAKSEKRFVKISLYGLLYLIGIAIGAHSAVTKVKLEIDPINEYEEVNDIIGSLLTLSSSLILVCYFVNEVLHWINTYDYKSSLDPDINRENKAGTLLIDKYFCVTRTTGETPINCRYEAKYPVNRMLAFFFIYSNVIPIAYFYFPFIYFNKHTLDIMGNCDSYIIFWFGVLGCGFSLVVQYFFTNRAMYFITIVIKIIGLGLFSALLLILEVESHHVVLYVLFCALGFHYQANDVNILSYGNMKYIEIEIFVSYMFQYLTIGIIQYMTLMEPKQFIDFEVPIVLPYYHGLFLMAALSVAIFLGACVLPKGKQISLLEIRNIINLRQPPVMIAHVLAAPQPSAPYLSGVNLDPRANQQYFHSQVPQYQMMACSQINSQSNIYNSNPVVLTPASAGGKW